MDVAIQTLLLAFGLGLLGFIEPCTIGVHMLFLGGQKGRPMSERLGAALIFLLARLVVMGAFGGLIVVFGQRLIGVQAGTWLVFGAIYLGFGLAIFAGWDKAMRHRIKFSPERWKAASNPILQGLAFGLNIPACAAPILFGLIGTATLSGSATTGFLMMAVFAVADSRHGHGGSDNAPFGQQGPNWMGDHPMMDQMMQMMMRMHGGMMQGNAGSGIGMMGSGPGMGMMPSAMGSMMDAFDADADGSLAPDELRQGLLSQLEQYDTDGDGTLALSEFQDQFLAMTREAMVDRFQHLDANGDGAITSEEMTAPADRMVRTELGVNGTMPMPGSMPRMDGSGNIQDN